MSTSAPQQALKVTGEINIDVQETIDLPGRGTVKFISGLPNGKFTEYGQMRIYGYRGFGNFIFETTMQNGFAFRTNKNQGDSSVGGDGQPYPLRIQGEATYIRSLQLQGPDNITGLNITRNITSDESFYNPFMDCSQNTIKPTEIIAIETGGSSVSSFTGFQAGPDDQSATTNLGILGMKRGNTVTTAMTWREDGEVNVPTKITADIVSATTYENLPVDDITPITLDPVNLRVGINTTNPPDETLQVGGNCHVDNQIRCAEIDAQTYLNLPPPDVSPITLDTVNNRVGILTTTPGHKLHVIGNGYFAGTVMSTAGFMPNGSGAFAPIIRAGNNSPEGVLTAYAGSLFMRQNGDDNTTLYVKGSGTGNTGWVPIGPSPTPPELDYIFIDNIAQPIGGIQNIALTLPTSNVLNTYYSKGCSETTTTISTTNMGVTIDKASCVVNFTEPGYYDINLRIKWLNVTSSGSNRYVFTSYVRKNGVDMPDDNFSTSGAPYNVTTSDVFLNYNFSRYIDITNIDGWRLVVYVNVPSTITCNAIWNMSIAKLT